MQNQQNQNQQLQNQQNQNQQLQNQQNQNQQTQSTFQNQNGQLTQNQQNQGTFDRTSPGIQQQQFNPGLQSMAVRMFVAPPPVNQQTIPALVASAFPSPVIPQAPVFATQQDASNWYNTQITQLTLQINEMIKRHNAEITQSTQSLSASRAVLTDTQTKLNAIITQGNNGDDSAYTAQAYAYYNDLFLKQKLVYETQIRSDSVVVTASKTAIDIQRRNLEQLKATSGAAN